MHFTKMEGCGNDYIYIDGTKESVSDKAGLSRRLSDRHFGIGSDGIIFINPSDTADFEMQMFNADGTEAEMCGNGIRCVAKFIYDKGLKRSETLRIQTKAGIKEIRLVIRDGVVTGATVDMGVPILKCSEIPVIAPGDDPVGIEIETGGKKQKVTCVSMGNPHCVVFVEDTAAIDIEKEGPLFENNTAFPKRINTEFVHVKDRGHIDMRVWERGSGETLACGTGACASAVACVLNGLTQRKIAVKLLGGILDIEYAEKDGHVYMTGPANTVFEGDV